MPLADAENHRDWPVFWRVEGSLAHLTAVRPIAYFTWNAHTFAERWARRGGLFLQALVRPALYASHRVLATRVLHVLLRGVSRDRLDLLGEEYFQYVLKRQLRSEGVEKLREWMTQNGQVVLVSQGLDHVMRPLAQYLGVERIVANRLEFRNGVATGRLLNPVIRPRGPLAILGGRQAAGRLSAEQLLGDLGLEKHPDHLADAISPAERQSPQNHSPLVVFDRQPGRCLSVRQALRGKQILLLGVTGFIGKVWLEHLLSEIPEIGKIYLLIRRQRNSSARRRFEKVVEASPVFDRLEQRYGKNLSAFLAEKVEVVEGDVTLPGLGLDAKTRQRLARVIDLVVNSSGLTDFNPDLRDALASNVEPATHLIEFLRASDQAALLHLSTCYVVGARDGRVAEDLKPNYTPAGVEDFSVERELRSLREL
ncbi:MAG TPA: SDR family oxidoreductase, partial [Rugosimonospora sp.]|nr:SDR family oxidoreductase [Rugosimonospora sp.]